MAQLGENFNFTKPDFGKSPIQFLKEVKVELSKVTWPTKETVIKLTAVVIVVSTIVAIYLGGLDFIFAQAIEFVLSKK